VTDITYGNCSRCDKDMIVEVEGEQCPQPCYKCRVFLVKEGVMLIWNEAEEGDSYEELYTWDMSSM